MNLPAASRRDPGIPGTVPAHLTTAATRRQAGVFGRKVHGRQAMLR